MDKKGIKAALHVLDGEEIADVIPLEKEVVVIGREDSDVTLDDPEVSGTHCQIQLLSGTYHLFDLNSTNGTFLNGQRIVKSRLAPGDIVRVGGVDFVFVIGPNSHKMPLAPPTAKAVAVAPSTQMAPTLPVQAVATAPVLAEIAPVLAEIPGIAGTGETAIPKSLEPLLRAIDEERRALLKQAKLVLDFEFSDGTREHYEMREHQVTLGRSSGVAKLERDDEISRKHAAVQLLPDGSIELSDLGSTNGTFLNETRVNTPLRLKRSDVVRIGQSKIRLRVAT